SKMTFFGTKARQMSQAERRALVERENSDAADVAAMQAAGGVWLWIFGLAGSFGFLGLWGPSTTPIAEVFPTRIRGVANGVVWFIGFFVGFVVWPFANVALQQAAGSFALDGER